MASNMLKRVEANKPQMYRQKDGTLKLMGVYGQIWPIMSIALLQKMLEDNFDEAVVQDLYYRLGYTQAYNATKWTIKKVGIPLAGNELKILKENMGHAEVTGSGKATLLTFDLKRKRASKKMQNDMVHAQYENMFGKPKRGVNHYQRGLFAGTLSYLFQEEVVVKINRGSSSEEVFEAVSLKEVEEKNLEEFKPWIASSDLNLKATEEFTLSKLLL